MTEELNKDTLEEEIVTKEPEGEAEVVEKEVDPIEATAREKGWKPLEEYEGDKETWVDAKEFVAREPLYKALHKANREIKKVKKETETVKQLYDKIETVAKEKAMKELQLKLKEAAEEKDIELALELKDQINELKAKPATEAPKNEEFENWIQSNKWYEADEDLRDFADAKGLKIAKANPDLSLDEIYNRVTESTRKAFPHKFNNTMKERPSTVDSGRQTTTRATNGSRKKSPSYDDLPVEVQDVYRKMVKKEANSPRGSERGIISHEEFITNYLAVGGTVNTGV